MGPIYYDPSDKDSQKEVSKFLETYMLYFKRSNAESNRTLVKPTNHQHFGFKPASKTFCATSLGSPAQKNSHRVHRHLLKTWVYHNRDMQLITLFS